MNDLLGRTTLPTILALDAVTCAAMGALLVTASSLIAALTAISGTVLFVAGLLLLPIAIFIAIVARGTIAWTWAVPAIVGGNLLWVFLSVGLPASGLIVPNALGWLFLMAQAAIVALFAGLELSSYRQSSFAA